MHDFTSGFVLIVFGIALVRLYAFVAKRRYGLALDFVQVILYRVNTKEMPFKERALETVLAWLKFFGLVLAITAPFVVFH
jgi:hypothetical protein